MTDNVVQLHRPISDRYTVSRHLADLRRRLGAELADRVVYIIRDSLDHLEIGPPGSTLHVLVLEGEAEKVEHMLAYLMGGTVQFSFRAMWEDEPVCQAVVVFTDPDKLNTILWRLKDSEGFQGTDDAMPGNQQRRFLTLMLTPK